MRLVCPNCDATYEVDGSVIPEAGRDVQCSNCGHTWFQTSPAVEAAEADEAALFDAPPPAVAVAEPPPPAPDQRVPARGLDETVLAVLREEAEREAAARRAEAAPIETQTEMGLSPAAAPAPIPEPVAASARKVAKLKGTEPDAAILAPRPQTRREMLPEIEEINSTLRATSEKRTGEPAAITETLPNLRPDGSGFRTGFVLMMLVAIIGVAVYVMAPRISQQIPGAAPTMTRYVDTVDSGRMWLDSVLQRAISALRGLTSDQSA